MSRTGHQSLEWPAWVLLPVVIGYLTMSRTFAYLGIAPLYIGEATLGLLLFFRPGMILGTWLGAQWHSKFYSRLADLAFVFVAYGLLQCVRGLVRQPYPMIALQNFAFNVYIAFLFAGMWLGDRHPNLLPKAMWYIAWANGLYGVVYLAMLGSAVSTYEIESGAVQPYGQPCGTAFAILGLLAFERNLWRAIVPLLLNAFVLLGVQMRAEWLSFAVALVALSFLMGRVSRLAWGVAALAGLLLLGTMINFEVPAPTGRSGVVSSHEILGRAIASVDEQTAYQFTPNAATYSGTVEWRTRWWRELIGVAHADAVSMLFGKGYGFPIWEYNELDGIVPTPHNIFVYVLVYTGWVGVLVFYALQFCLARLLWIAYRVSGQPFGLALWILSFVWAHFDNRLETPFGAIPFYVLVGMALTSAMAATRDSPSATASSAVGA
jgi:hypothetical protein